MISLEELKNLDSAALGKLILENQTTVIKVLLIFVSLVIAGIMFNGHISQEKNLRAKIAMAQQKILALNSRDAANRDLDKFKSSVPKNISESELIDLISQYAKNQQVAISSLSPAENKDMGLYDIINVGFEAQSSTFKRMMIFLRSIEKSGAPLIIDSWSGHANENGDIVFSLKISAVDIHTS